MLSASADGKLQLWDKATGARLGTIVVPGIVYVVLRLTFLGMVRA